MGQFLDYIASVFNVTSNRVEPNSGSKVANHVTFADNSFTQAFGKMSEADKNKIIVLSKTNRRTIYLYSTIAALAFICHLAHLVCQRLDETFDLLRTESWQLITLSILPLFVYGAAISAMQEINQPISDGTRLTSKNSGLDLNNNDFIYSLKVVILLMALCQIISIVYSEQAIWTAILIVPIWCYRLTTKVAQSEYKRFAPSPKKQWVKLNMSRSPKQATPRKQAQHTTAANNATTDARATPRTRTRRAVKNIITGVSDKYHAFEQNVAHQLSQKIFTPMSPKVKALE